MIPFSSIFLPNDCNFLIHLTIQANLTQYAHIVNHTTTKILVNNISDCPLRILRHQKLDYIVDICYENCFLANAQATFNFAVFLLRTQLFFNLYNGIALASMDMEISIETQLNNGVRVYGNRTAIREISKLVAQYSFI